MVRKIPVLVLAVGLLLGAFGTVASAAQNVANVSQKGSLLVFPRIDTRAVGNPEDGLFRDTIIIIGNDNSQEVWLRCFWVSRDQDTSGFVFLITANQPIWFRASDGAGTGRYDALTDGSVLKVPSFFADDNTTGELKCWAVDAGDTTQLVFNHLYGSAIILDPVANTAFQYPAWRFTARSAGTAGAMVLDGATQYDACPQYLLFNFFAKGATMDLAGGGDATFLDSTLTLVPCHQDLRQDRFPTCTKAKFDIWNENEVKYSGVHQCLKCWFEGYLADIGKTAGGYGGEAFEYENLFTVAGRFRVQGVASRTCRNVFTTTDGTETDQCWTDPTDTTNHGQVATPLLGIISAEINLSTGTILEALTGTPANTAGAWGPPLDSSKFPVPRILWDPDAPPAEGLQK